MISIRNEVALMPALRMLKADLDAGRYIVDLEGVRTVELIGARIDFYGVRQAVMDFGPAKKTNEKYVNQELAWYLSEDLNVDPMMSNVHIWQTICDKDGKINSNYGWLIFSEKNGYQYMNCVDRLVENPNTKRGVMIYTRPSMWTDCKKNGMQDFICTDGVQCVIREGRLIYMVKQRSCDLIFGLFNDLAWHQWVYNEMTKDLRSRGVHLVGEGMIMYFPFNLHVYEKHFERLTKMVEYGEEHYASAD